MLAPNSNAPGAARSTSNPASALGSSDFFRLLITQLTNQDPLEPTGNEELLRQIASIREIELSTTLTESLRAMTGQQQFGSVSGLIGQFVTGAASDGVVHSGIVAGIRFVDGGGAIVQLSSGVEVPLEKIVAIQSPLSAANALIGQRVTGVDRSDSGEPQLIDGVVSGVVAESHGGAKLELDTGEALALEDVLGVTAGV